MSTVGYLNKYYYNKKNWIDGTSYFVNLVKIYCRPDFSVLDLGCGSGAGKEESYSVKNYVRMLVGIDLSDNIFENRIVPFRVLGDVFSLPFTNSSFHLIYSDFLIEHIDEPDIFVAEIFRVLKTQGLFIFRTPNKYHYIPIIGGLIPAKFRSFVANIGRKIDLSTETFRTYYKMNTAHQVRNTLIHNGFKLIHLEVIEKEPSYMMFNELAFLSGLVFERFVNSSHIFSFLRANIIGVFQKSG